MLGTSSRPDLDEIVALLQPVSERVFARFQFRRDPLYGRVAPEFREELIAGALRCGAQAAAAFDRPFRASDTLARNGVEIVEAPTPDMPGFVLLASYTAAGSGGVLRLSSTSLDRLCTVQDVLGVGSTQIRDMILAHELFHHVETHTAGIFTQAKHVPTWSFLGHRRYAQVRALSEIAANAFSRRLLDAPFSPHLLEVVAAYLSDAAFGRQLVDEINEIQRQTGDPTPDAPTAHTKN